MGADYRNSNPKPALSTVPGPPPAEQARRRDELTHHKRLALGLLIVAAVVYIACQVIAHTAELGAGASWWVGLIRTGAEAGMVGGLADWFAVTALFRHPLGLPIPHTAIVKTNKDRIGRSLAGFVGENFLNAELIIDRLQKMNVPTDIGRWLATPGNAELCSRKVGEAIVWAVNNTDEKEVTAIIKSAVVDKAAEPAWGPPAGRLLEQLIAEGHTEPVIEQFAAWLHRQALRNPGFFDRIVDDKLPGWAPGFMHTIAADKLYREVIGFTEQIATDPTHEFRRHLARIIAEFADDLQHNDRTIAKVEQLKQEVLASRAVTDLPAVMWQSIAGNLNTQASDSTSLLRTKITAWLVTFGNALLDDTARRRWLDTLITKGARFITENYGDNLTSLISDTIAGWDTDETVDKIELMVGKDLQYIRMNGTIVGSLAGVAIYLLSSLAVLVAGA
ncbi:DUF445 domain-containing protein [Corynebacterium mendelii]|uniref:DUF445 family protein n=1 Tax=Corynebacterium mendelii TaxID=2765362 RepID=A0A939DZQ8_9CORY|nr:DUF445 family protein [Corynebacterium mendelii]MBN9643815.1 DUF445 family protein [Corynebacterium mendelii]